MNMGTNYYMITRFNLEDELIEYEHIGKDSFAQGFTFQGGRRDTVQEWLRELARAGHIICDERGLIWSFEGFKKVLDKNDSGNDPAAGDDPKLYWKDKGYQFIAGEFC